jgi:hypothetical protein
MASSLNQYKYSTNSIFIGERTKIFLSGLAVKDSITVHSVFHKVINLRTTQGLFSIVTSEVGRHNNYIVVTKLPNDDFLSINLSNNPSCILSQKSLVLDNKLSISLNLAKPWKGILDNGFKWKLSELKNESLLYLKTALCIYSKENSFFEK